MILSKKQITKALIRLRGCSGWSAPVLFANPRRQVFSQRGPYKVYSKTCLKRPLKKDQKIGFHDRLLLNAGQKYCRMLQRKHSAILSTFIKVSLTINILVLSIFEWPLKTGFTVLTALEGSETEEPVVHLLEDYHQGRYS